MARKTKQEAEKTRLNLIHTALMVFSEKGVANTTLTDIAKAAGVTKGAFYWHFENKHQIFEAIFDTYAQETDEKAEAIIRQGEDPIQSVKQAIYFLLQTLEEDTTLQAVYSLYFFKCEYTKEFAPILQREQRESKEALVLIMDALSRLPAQQRLDPVLCQHLASSIVDYMTGIMLRWLRDREGSLREQGMIGVDLLLAGAGVLPASGIQVSKKNH